MTTSSKDAAAPPDDSLLPLWQNPPAAFRGKPFWSWNGKLEKEELLRQARIFARMGMGGFFMHSRTGLVTEYLGDEWFDLINACSDEAKKLGLEAWLYDEDRWPSGSAGGLATKDPRYRMKLLRGAVRAPGAAIEWGSEDRFVAAFAARVEGIDFSHCRRLARGEMVPANSGESVLLFTTETTPEDSFYNGNTYLDTLRRDATGHFLTVTHDRYLERCENRLGGDIKGIFTDEPHHGMVMCVHNDQQNSRESGWTTPWTEAFFPRFQETFGYDLRDHLPELFMRRDGERLSPVKWQYMELLQQMFLDEWASPLHDWCKAHGMQLTGHVLHEDSLAAQAVPCGSLMRYYEYMDVPGVDVLALNNENFWLVKQLSSVGRQHGKKWLLSELYGCTGWQMDFAGHKRIGDWQALFGINIRCHHLSWYTMAGEAKRDYPASISFQSRWYEEYAGVEQYFSRLHVLLQAGEAACDVLVVNPVESTWAQIHAGWARWLGSNSPDVDRVEKQYAEIFRWLTGAQIDFDYGDEDHLRRYGRVTPQPEGGPLLELGHCVYRVVLVAGMETIRASTLDVLRKFADAGGQVIFAGEPPRYVDARLSRAALELATAGSVPWEAARITSAVRAYSRAARALTCDTPGILCQVRRDGERWIIVALNPNADQSYHVARFRFTVPAPETGPWQVQEWDCLRGERFTVRTDPAADGLAWSSDFPPLAERAFVLTAHADPAALPAREAFNVRETRRLEGPFDYALDEPNLCVLDFAAWQFNGGPWEPETEILKVDEAIRARLGLPGRSGTMVQPWARPAARRGFGPLRMRFSFDVADVPPGGVELLVETPETFEMQVNGIPVTPTLEWLIDPCLKRVPVAAVILRAGENVVELATEFFGALDLEAIFIAGNFGVTLTGRRASLGRLPERLQTGDVTAQGLPFYSGRISYRLPIGDTREGLLSLDPVGSATVKLKAANGTEFLLPWKPYDVDLQRANLMGPVLTCELYLTRRNTFGPLHEVPKEQAVCGPTSFRTTGEKFSEDYQLFPCGLISAPTLGFGTAK